MTTDPARPEQSRWILAIPEWSWIALVGLLVLTVWWRAHTFGPSVRERTGLTLWPQMSGETEPLDCDEAAYGYIGRRLLAGDVLYRDLTENKPPGGYWIYELAIALGGPTELTIRLLPIPLVLLTLGLVWWLGLVLAGPVAGCLAGLLFALLSTDPYLYGNGANLEHAFNLFSVGSLAALVRGWRSPARGWLALAGALVGVACLVKQVAIVNLPLCTLLALWRPEVAGSPAGWRRRLVDALAPGLGFTIVWLAAIAILVGQGAGPAAYEDIVVYGLALARDTPPAANAPPWLVRWFTGNSDPRTGALPWPFGRTDWLVWWGTGSWPLWLAAMPGLIALVRGRPIAEARLVALWTASAWFQVAMPGLFWAHYYLLPTAGIALAVAVGLVTLSQSVRTAWRQRRRRRAFAAGLGSATLLLAIVGTGWIQVRDYLLVPPEQLTVRYKGGGQWVRLRQIGLELKRRSSLWPVPTLYVWGWQSPLYFYSGLDSPSRHFFANELLKAYADRPHPWIGRWVDEIAERLQERPPSILFTGDPPFPALRTLIQERYGRSRLVPEAPVLWIERQSLRDFERMSRTPIRMMPQPVETAPGA